MKTGLCIFQKLSCWTSLPGREPGTLSTLHINRLDSAYLIKSMWMYSLVVYIVFNPWNSWRVSSADSTVLMKRKSCWWGQWTIQVIVCETIGRITRLDQLAYQKLKEIGQTSIQGTSFPTLLSMEDQWYRLCMLFHQGFGKAWRMRTAALFMIYDYWSKTI